MLPPPALFQGVSMFPVNVGFFALTEEFYKLFVYCVNLCLCEQKRSIWRASWTLGMGVPGRLSSPQRESSSPSPLPKPHPTLRQGRA